MARCAESVALGANAVLLGRRSIRDEAVVKNLKALDPNRPIREADIC
jgi:hypothetical protein